MRTPSSFFPHCAGARSSAPTASLASTATEKANKGEGTPAASWTQGANHRALPSRQAGPSVLGGPIGSYGCAEGRRDGRRSGDWGPRAPERALGTPGAAGRGRGGTGAGPEPIAARVCAERAGGAAARAIRADASGPGSPGSQGGGGEEKARRARVRSGAGRSRDLAAGWEAASEPRTGRAAGARTMGEKPGTR